MTAEQLAEEKYPPYNEPYLGYINTYKRFGYLAGYNDRQP
jgi:hypothetical protein